MVKFHYFTIVRKNPTHLQKLTILKKVPNGSFMTYDYLIDSFFKGGIIASIQNYQWWEWWKKFIRSEIAKTGFIIDRPKKKEMTSLIDTNSIGNKLIVLHINGKMDKHSWPGVDDERRILMIKCLSTIFASSRVKYYQNHMNNAMH